MSYNRESLREKIAIATREYERKNGKVKTLPLRSVDTEKICWRTRQLVNLDINAMR